MRRLLLIILLLFGCVAEPIDPSALVCVPDEEGGVCDHGGYLKACSSADNSRCGYEVYNTLFWCDHCGPGGCDYAASIAVDLCYTLE